MVKTRMIAKNCPKCSQKVAVALKSCRKCGHNFNAARQTSTSKTKSPDNEIQDERRRTGRVRREKPNYYNSQEYDKKKKRPKSKSTTSISESNDDKTSVKESKDKDNGTKKKRVKKEDGNGDLAAKLPKEKQELAALILSEINRKINSVVWKPT